VGIEWAHRFLVEGRIARSFGRKHSARWALSRCVERHRRKELFEFWDLRRTHGGIFAGLLNTLKDSA
jgi:hypothetical protein